jgi:Zn-dependent membrane protease YugP
MLRIQTLEGNMFFDPLWLIIAGPGILISLWASFKVKSTFKKYSEMGIASGKTGAQVAEELLKRRNIRGVRVEPHEGWLSDHYDPIKRVVKLSPDVYNGRSISSVGVAAHECGHAIQHAEGYAPMAVRQNLVWPANLGNTLSFILIIAGAIFAAKGLIWLGILLFTGVVAFQLVTLPVEFNASTRARRHLVAEGIIGQGEEVHVGKVLNAAAMTYVAALIASILQLAYFLIRFAGVGSDD